MRLSNTTRDVAWRFSSSNEISFDRIMRLAPLLYPALTLVSFFVECHISLASKWIHITILFFKHKSVQNEMLQFSTPSSIKGSNSFQNKIIKSYVPFVFISDCWLAERYNNGCFCLFTSYCGKVVWHTNASLSVYEYSLRSQYTNRWKLEP